MQCKWNGITDPRQVTVGQKLIVAKADPSKPTAAEEQAEARRLRAKVRAGKILAAAGMRDLDKEAEERDKRRELRQIRRQRTEMSKGSMNERMHRALAEGDDAEFVYLDAEGHKYDANVYNIGHRISGTSYVGEEGREGGGGVGLFFVCFSAVMYDNCVWLYVWLCRQGPTPPQRAECGAS